MEDQVTRDGGGATDDLSKTRTPAVAAAFYLRVLKTLYPNMPVRHGREIKTLCFILEFMANGKYAHAADVAAQSVMALEKSLADQGNWAKAQYCELVPQDRSTLMDEDMEFMATKELSFQQRLSVGGKGEGS